MAHLLLVDDEESLRSVVAERLTDHGFEVVQAADGESALKALDGFAFDVIVSDLRLPGVDGRQVIDAALTRYPGIVAIVVTGYGTVKDAVDIIKRGAADFISKPFQFDELMHVLTNALEQKRLKSENAYLHKQLDERFGLGSMVGKSAAMRALFQLIETVAPTAATILISGETGTGKEMVARAIHQTSPRHRERFVAINVSAIPETLLDAELFGHVRGAFTGAVAMRQGRLEQADKGTLFLDEVGTMPMALQMKMLRVLQEREFERVGDNRTIKVDVRIVAATNADLLKMVKDGTFREDLYYRLNVIGVHLTPLRERPDDIPPLVQNFLRKLSDRDPGSRTPDPDRVARSHETTNGSPVAGQRPPARKRRRARAGHAGRPHADRSRRSAARPAAGGAGPRRAAGGPAGGRHRPAGYDRADREGPDRPRPRPHGAKPRRRRPPAGVEADDPRRETEAHVILAGIRGPGSGIRGAGAGRQDSCSLTPSDAIRRLSIMPERLASSLTGAAASRFVKPSLTASSTCV